MQHLDEAFELTCLSILTYASSMLTYADVCLLYADVCLLYGDVCSISTKRSNALAFTMPYYDGGFVMVSFDRALMEP